MSCLLYGARRRTVGPQLSQPLGGPALYGRWQAVEAGVGPGLVSVWARAGPVRAGLYNYMTGGDGSPARPAAPVWPAISALTPFIRAHKNWIL